MKKIYIYADETEQELNGELYLGYGLLLLRPMLKCTT